MPYIIAYFGKYLVRLILFTCRVRVQGLQEFVHIAEKHQCILMLWHDRLVIVAEILRKNVPQFIYTAFISKSCDGEALAIFSLSYRFGRVIRVSHCARHLALTQVIHNLKENREIMIMTPDGPKGPRHVVKPGIALASKESDAKIIPFSWSADKYWSLSTWDKMMIPKPFSKICVHFGDAISIQKDSENSLDDDVILLQKSMQEVSATH